MPRHKQVTTCLNGSASLSKFCTCQHCTLSVCSVCGAYEGGLTTDCPGERVAYDRQREVSETNLDYTDERGWHLAQTDDGTPIASRSPRFEDTKPPPDPLRVDPRSIVAPSTDWAAVDRTLNLQHELAQKAIGWVLADRACEERSATLARTKDEAALLHGKLANYPRSDLDKAERELLAKLERDQIDFRMSDQRTQKCDDEFRQTARRLVAALEKGAKGTP